MRVSSMDNNNKKGKTMDMNEREAYKLYKQGGQYLVYDYVNQGFLRYDKWEYCGPCECESPIYKSHCLVCSTQYKNNRGETNGS